MLGLIWAEARGGVIGFEGDMPWSVPEDMKHFVSVTRGHPVVMGRRTWESLQLQPLPGRLNVVVSRGSIELPDGAVLANSVAEALAVAEGAAENGEVWGIGGAQLYGELIAHADVVERTELDVAVPGDTLAPRLGAEWRPVSEGEWLESVSGIRYRFVRLERA